MSVIIKPIGAYLLKGKEYILFNRDPYVVIELGNEAQKSMTHKSGGKSPQWSDAFEFRSLSQMMRVSLWDQDTFSSDDLIGRGELDLTPAYLNPYVKDTKYIDIINNGANVARVEMDIEYQGQAMNNNNNNNMNMNNNNMSMNNGDYNHISGAIGKEVINRMGNENNNSNYHPIPQTNNENIMNIPSKTDLSMLGTTHFKNSPTISVLPQSGISSLGMSHLSSPVLTSTVTSTPITVSRIPVSTTRTILSPVNTISLPGSSYVVKESTTVIPGFTETKILTPNGISIVRSP